MELNRTQLRLSRRIRDRNSARRQQEEQEGQDAPASSTNKSASSGCRKNCKKCPMCQKSVRDITVLRGHKRSKHATRTLDCTFCTEELYMESSDNVYFDESCGCGPACKSCVRIIEDCEDYVCPWCSDPVAFAEFEIQERVEEAIQQGRTNDRPVAVSGEYNQTIVETTNEMMVYESTKPKFRSVQYLNARDSTIQRGVWGFRPTGAIIDQIQIQMGYTGPLAMPTGSDPEQFQRPQIITQEQREAQAAVIHPRITFTSSDEDPESSSQSTMDFNTPDWSEASYDSDAMHIV